MWQFLHRSIRRTERQVLPTFPASVRMGGWFQVLMLAMLGIWSTCSIAWIGSLYGDDTRGIQSGDFKYTSKNGLAAITEYTGAADAVRIPDTLDSLPVRAIAKFRVKDGTGITSLALPAGVTDVDWRAFASCGKLENIIVDPANPAFCSSNGDVFSHSMTYLVYVPPGRAGVYAIPDSVTRVREFAFAGNTRLSRVRIPGSVRDIDMYAFGGETRLQEIEVAPDNANYRSVDGILYNHKGTLLLKYPPMREGDFSVPDGVVAISPNACEDVLGMKQLAIPASVKKIGRCAFSGCLNLKSVSFAEGVSVIGPWAFHGCEGLTEVELPAGLTRIEGNVFEGCARLEKVSLPHDLKVIDDQAFQNCGRLHSLHLPDGVTRIGRNAFRDCTSLKVVRLPPDLGVMERGLFSGCLSLTRVAISPGVTNLEESVFAKCPKLADIYVDAANPAFTSFDGVLYSRDMKALLHYPAALSGSFAIPDSIDFIAAHAFSGCTGLTQVIFPVDLASIGEDAFSGCTGLEQVRVREKGAAPAANHSLPASAGYHATERRWQRIGPMAFSGCSSLRSVDLPSGITKIGYGVFSGCSELERVTLPGSLEQLGAHAFRDCAALTDIRLPARLKRMEESTFLGCASLRGVYVEQGNSQFADAQGVLLNHKKTVLLCYPPAFSDEYRIPEGVQFLESESFRDCARLNKLIIPASVYLIGKDAFAGAGLKDVYFLGKAPAPDGRIFGDTSEAVVHRIADAPGWPDAGEKWQGMPSVLWDGKNPVSAEAGVEKSPR